MYLRYLFQRVVFLFFVVITAASLNFVLPRLTGQNPIRERLAEQMLSGSAISAGVEELVATYDAKFGLDKPIWRQYLTYMGDLLRFDLGYSIPNYPRRVSDIIGEAIPWTIGLIGVSTLLSFTLGTILGALSAWRWTPQWVRFLSYPFIALSGIPFYLLGLILLFIFAFQLRWLPGNGGYGIGSVPNLSIEFALEVLRHSILPALSIVLSSIGFWAIAMRGMMVTVEGEDYMILAEAKGLKKSVIFGQYAVRNSLLPQVTNLALSLGFVMSGSVLVEVVFGYPGVGFLLFRAIQGVDYPLVQGIILVLILTLALSLLLVDLILPLIDPRIQLNRQRMN